MANFFYLFHCFLKIIWMFYLLETKRVYIIKGIHIIPPNPVLMWLPHKTCPGGGEDGLIFGHFSAYIFLPIIFPSFSSSYSVNLVFIASQFIYWGLWVFSNVFNFQELCPFSLVGSYAMKITITFISLTMLYHKLTLFPERNPTLPSFRWLSSSVWEFLVIFSYL